MKYLLLMLIVILVSCNQKPIKQDHPVKPDVTQKHLGDSVLERPDIDIKYANMRRAQKGKPGQPPPPPVIHPGCILLDFDGQLVSGTMWNTNGDILCAPSGLDGLQIQTVFDSVQKRYLVFDSITVTLNETVYNSFPQNKRIRCIITTSNDWYGSGAGGVAYLNSFSWFDETPCFVFTALQNFNERNIGDAATHEPGHTLGLRHQILCDANGVKLSEYNWGNGIEAPIMGASYNSSWPKWWIGPNSLGCSIIQNDTAVIYSTLKQ